jgi:sensor histidine kinase YesM
LEGLEDRWTDWSTSPRREFTSLPYRAFVLHLQARSLDGRESPDLPGGVLAFSIAPPWWLTRWAVAGYGVTGLLAVAGLVMLRTRVLHHRSAALEAQVTARTLELHGRNQELARLHQLELDEKTSARLAEEKARLELLRYQLNPHFLYNALNSIYGQIESKPAAAAEMVVRVAEFCRATLTRGTDALQTVDDELKMIASYLMVEKARWGEDLEVQIDANTAARARALPSFVLLPLVENAIKYGSVTNPGVLHIRVSVRVLAGDHLELEVANTGQWIEPGTASETLPGIASTGIGYENLRARLQRFYPGRHVLAHESADGWVKVKLSLAPLPAKLAPASSPSLTP